jgi:hypothetical protein
LATQFKRFDHPLAGSSTAQEGLKMAARKGQGASVAFAIVVLYQFSVPRLLGHDGHFITWGALRRQNRSSHGMGFRRIRLVG